jgi:phage tail sheath gpL-like
MSVLNLGITTARPDSYLEQNFETPGGKQAIAQRLADYIERIISGNESAQDADNPPSIAISVQGNAVRASGTFTLTSVVATDACSINGVSFTAVASGATGNQFNVGVDDTATAVNLAAAINASVTALVENYVTASASGTVVTVTSAFYGLSGNQTLIASADSTIVASGSRLTNGAEDATAQTLNF